jgi:surface antigen
MRTFGAGAKIWSLSSALLLSYPIVVHTAYAAQSDRRDTLEIPSTTTVHPHLVSNRIPLAPEPRLGRTERGFARRGASRSYGISCVPYARQVSGIMVVGNAWQWWSKAAGRYARGDRPEPGSVLNFRPNGRMALGHVAVVKQVVNAREVIVDHANWSDGGGHGNISRNVTVVDVSEANNWSAVRVELGNPSTFGSVYPTYGFIYNRPDTGAVTADIARPAPQPAINPVPSDLRPVAERPWRTTEEVAESVDAPARRMDVRLGGMSNDR